MVWAIVRWNFVNTAAIAGFCALPILCIKAEDHSKIQFTTDTVRTQDVAPGERRGLAQHSITEFFDTIRQP